MSIINLLTALGKFKLTIIDVTDIYEKLLMKLPKIKERKAKDVDLRMVRGNFKTRLRMAILYYYSNLYRYLVCGTSDKSEIILGYFTKWGDIAGDIMPLRSIYKTQVRKVAKKMNIGFVATKPSSPEFWRGHLAEKELPAPYDLLDPILLGLEKGWPDEKIAEDLGIKVNLVRETKKFIEKNKHKRMFLKIDFNDLIF